MSNQHPIDLTNSPNVVTPSTPRYNNYNLNLVFFQRDDDQPQQETNTILFNSPTQQTARTLRMVLLFLKGEQEKFRGLAEARGEHWRNSWSSSINTITNYWQVYGEEPKWYGSMSTYLFGIGDYIADRIRAFIEANNLMTNEVVIGGHVCNVGLVGMLRAGRYYRAAKAIGKWSDECRLTYIRSERKIFKGGARGASLEVMMNNYFP